MTEAHKPKYQNAPVGRFCVCVCTWRSSFGDRKQGRGRVQESPTSGGSRSVSRTNPVCSACTDLKIKRDHETCHAPDCDKLPDRRGMCYKHEARWLRTGTTDLIDRKPTLADHTARFQRYISEPNEDGCWLWRGTTTKSGILLYGQFKVEGVRWTAHRYAHHIWIGPIPDGHEVDHVYTRGCRSTLCVNPAHLEAVTQRENLLRQVTSITAIHRRKTHCIRGHEFTPENTGPCSRNGRACRQCSRERLRAKRKAKREATV